MRSFLFFVVLTSLPLGWVGRRLSQRQIDRAVVREIKEKGGSIEQIPRTEPILADRFFTWLESVAGESSGEIAYNCFEIGPGVQPGEAGRLVRLATDRFNHLSSISVTNPGISSPDLAHVGNCAALDHLHLWGTPIDDAALPHLARARGLREINLQFTDVSDGGLEHLLSLPKLAYLDLRGTFVTAEGIARLRAERPGVKVLWAPRLSKEATAAARALAQRGWLVDVAPPQGSEPPLVEIRVPSARECASRLEDLELLGAFSRLKVVYGGWDADHEFIHRLMSLEALDEFAAYGFEEEFLMELGHARRLRSLALAGTVVPAHGLLSLERFPRLEALKLAVAIGPLTRAESEQIAELSSLRRLGLIFDELAPESLLPLGRLQELRELNIRCRRIAPQGADALAGLGRLESFRLEIGRFNDDEVESVCGLTGLTSLEVSETNISDAGLLKIIRLSNLRKLDIRGCIQITRHGLSRFRAERPEVEVYSDFD